MNFRHYTICQDPQGATVEVWRGTDEVACLAFDNNQLCFVELHVAITAPDRSRDAASFQTLVQQATPLRHRHLLGIIEGGEDEGSNYHITSFLDGERLDSWLARSPPLPPWLALLIIRQLVAGLAALANHPQLLAGVEVFHAGLTLTGPHPDDITVKICDLGLSGIRSATTEPQRVEARAIHETGRLLLYMLTGTLAEGPVTPASLAARPLAPELIFLLTTIFQPAQPHHPRTLEQLRTLTDRCLHDLSPDLTARPDLVPLAYRPRLPLSAYLPAGPATAERLSNEFTLDPRTPDAGDPYRYRGTERATRRPVNAQLLPPPCLLPAEHLLPALEKAWTVLSGSRNPHLLTPLAFLPDAPAPLLVEEFPGKYTLDSLRRLRTPLDPAEVHLLLSKIDEAAVAAEALGLPLHWRCPSLLSLQFSGPGGGESIPPPAQLARLSLTDWPAFTIKIRTWPLTLDFTQPDRFQLERLLPRDPALTGDPPNSIHPAAPPCARDFALLALWLLGGSASLKEQIKPLLYSAISARGPALASRSEFLTRFQTAAAAPATHFSPSKSKSKPRIKTSPVPPWRPATASRPLTVEAIPQHLPNPVPSAGYQDPAEESEGPTLGFAEALFGNLNAAAPRVAVKSNGSELPHYPDIFDRPPIWPAPPESFDDFSSRPEYDPDAPPEGVPLGFMEAARQSGGWDPDTSSPYPDTTGKTSRSRWMLLLIVVLIAAGLAALMAQLSGQAIWLK